MWEGEFLGGLALPAPIIAARLLGATLLCGLIGLEREVHEKAAGLRTHMLVGLGAAVFALITIHLVARYQGDSSAIRLDPIRLVEACTAGVAFLAAGMIVFSRGEVKGLTTGAVMWLSAAVGLAVGIGLWPVAVLTTVLAVVISFGLKLLENRFLK